MGKIRKATESSSKDEKPRKKFKKGSPHKKKYVKGDKQGKKDDPTDSSASTSEKWSKSKKKRMRKIMAKAKNDQATGGNNKNTGGAGDSSAVSKSNNKAQTATTDSTTLLPDTSSSDAPPTAVTTNSNTKKTKSKFQDASKARLAGSRFRILNEELYTTTSEKSYDKFKENPELFEQYHEGFRHQVESWPENPVDVIVNSLTSTYNKNKSKSKKAKKSKTSPCVVADFGCGDAQLATDLMAINKQQNGEKDEDEDAVFKVHSFDLVSPNELVTACDMADVPLKDKTVDVCVFCLSLMGTNLADFIREAHRVLKDDGRVQIAEVRSRIEYSHSRKGKNSNSNSNNNNKTNNKESSSSSTDATTKTEGTLEEFTGVLGKLGFECVGTDRTNTMFLLLELKKNGKRPNKNLEFSAKPCIYKRR